ncbi:MAG: PspC domain-containing protein, partial [Microlunatus sp.]|nr:PspC domain-containing protein [Microlunatus sp.]
MAFLGAERRSGSALESGSDPSRPRTEPDPPPAPDSGPAADPPGASSADTSVRDKVLETATRKAEQESAPGPRRATRVSEGALLGGVCTGLARHLGWPLMVIRIGFVALALTQFVGVIAYAALWLLMPPEPRTTAPGLEAHSRHGLRQVTGGRR